MFFKHITLLLLLLVSAQAITLETMKSEPRVALLIANGDYDDDTLVHAVSQADAFNQMLIAQGFKTLFVDDVSKREIIKALRKFNNMLQPNGIALFYYQGKVVQHQKENYLIPLESYIEDVSYIQKEAISLDDISSKMEKMHNRLNIFVLDGTANEPYALEKGFASITTKNSDIYMVAQDNQVVNGASIFTPNLVEILSKKGISKSNIKRGINTLQRTNKQSKPYIKTTSIPFYFNIPQTLTSPQTLAWYETKRIDSLDAYAQFLSKYPNGKYAVIAQDRIKTLTQDHQDTSTTQVIPFTDNNQSKESL